MCLFFRIEASQRRQIRGIALALTCAILLQLMACGFADKVDHVKEQVTERASDWYQSIDLDVFKRGWEHAVDYASTAYATALSTRYVQSVGTAINELKQSLNQAYGSARSVAQEAGFAAEKWVAGTFNIDAAARGSRSHAEVANSHRLGSVDVTTTYGEDVSLKYYRTPSGSAQKQATTWIEAYGEYKNSASAPISLEEYFDKHGKGSLSQDALFESIYAGQTRIIPEDQFDDAVAYLTGRIRHLKSASGAAAEARVKSLEETLGHLKTRLEAPDGTASRPMTYEQMQAVAELSQKGTFDPSDFGITPSSIITPKYILKQATGAGTSAAAIETVLSIGPDIYSILAEAARTGAFDSQALQEMGIDGLLSGAKGFIEGSVSFALVSACEAGKLGPGLVDASPGVIGALTVLLLDAIRYGYALSQGTITVYDYSNLIAEDIVVSAGSLGGGALVALFLPATPIAYMAGCLAGGMVAVAGFSMAKEVVLEVKDGDGFAAILPTKVQDGLVIAKDVVEGLHIADRVTSFKDLAVSTLSNGCIQIKSAF